MLRWYKNKANRVNAYSVRFVLVCNVVVAFDNVVVAFDNVVVALGNVLYFSYFLKGLRQSQPSFQREQP